VSGFEAVSGSKTKSRRGLHMARIHLLLISNAERNEKIVVDVEASKVKGELISGGSISSREGKERKEN